MVDRRDLLLGMGGAAVGIPLGSRPSANAFSSDVTNPSLIDPALDSRSISFENPTGARGAGGTAHHGRKGRPNYILAPGESVVLADIQGAGTIRHMWMTMEDWRPEVMRALRFEVFYDGMTEPSISVPILDFFGLPHGRLREFYSSLISVHEGVGLNTYIPMPFARSFRAVFQNESAHYVTLFYQIDYTQDSRVADAPSYLHAGFRRDNPTRMKSDFVITDGLRGPGRFLGCSVGIRVIDDSLWYGEGEVKIYRDGDTSFPTYCGTGLEDYLGSAWALTRHYGPYGGSPIQVPEVSRYGDPHDYKPELVSFYRWHLPDPVMFDSDLKVTIQQIGSQMFTEAQTAEFEAFRRTHTTAGQGWLTDIGAGLLALSLVERTDDYCATAFVYCRTPQPIGRYDTSAAIADISLKPGEPRIGVQMPDEVRDRVNSIVKNRGGL